LDRKRGQNTGKEIERDRELGYIQNAEQGNSTVWKKLKERQS